MPRNMALRSLHHLSRAVVAVLVLVVGLSGAAVAAANDGQAAVGVNCVTPLDLVSPFQDLSNCNLKGVTINGNVPVLGGNPLYGSNLSGANLNGATVIGGYKPLQYANLTGANLKGATLGGGPNEIGVLQSANLTGANLSRATIAGARPLSLTNLTAANLNRASITWAVGVDVEPPLAGAVYADTTCPDGTNSDNNGGTCVGHGVPSSPGG